MRIVVTGASQGIGAAIARAFAARPSAELVLWSRRREALERVAAECRTLGAQSVAVEVGDVTDEAAVAMVASRVLAQGPPDVLVNNAGAFVPGPLATCSVETFRQQLDVNLLSAFLVSRSCLPAMVEAGRGHLVFLGSVASIRAYAAGGAYTAAKHGLLGLARSYREELKPAGVRVTTILAGATRTPSWDGVDLPEERFIPAEDVAAAVVQAVTLSDRTVIEELLVRPQLGDI